jgi:ABC-type multidrug transport system fused ATPase/permease subunit
MADPSPRTVLFPIAKRHARALGLTYALTLVENGFRVAYPLAIGHAIDRLLASDPNGLIPLAIVWMAHIIVGLGRHVYDTRAFTSVYNDLIGEMVTAQRGRGVPPETLAARAGLARELIGFLQISIPALVSAVTLFIGAIIMLFSHDRLVGMMALLALVPMLGAMLWFSRRSYALNARLNDRLEREIDVVTRQSTSRLHRHLFTLRGWRIRISNAEATTWGIIEISMLILAISVLVRLAGLDGVTPGFIYAVLAYVFDFYESLNNLPIIIQDASRAADISQRIADSGCGGGRFRLMLTPSGWQHYLDRDVEI